jgi:hypothetical protein
VPVFYAEPVTLDVTSSDSDELPGQRATKLEFAFDKPVSGLSVDDIAVSPNGTGAVKGTKLSGSEKNYTLTLTSVTASGMAGITVTKDGYEFKPSSIEVPVRYTEQVTLDVTAADGDELPGTSTTALSLSFNKSVTNLGLNDITITANGTGAAKGALSGSGTSYKLEVSNVTNSGTIGITVTKDGYEFKPSSIEVPVRYAAPVTLAVTPADGDELLGERTTKLTLAFNEAVDGLNLNDITITANGTGAAKGSLAGGGKSYTLTLASNSVTKSGTVEVTVTKDGYDISGAAGKVYDNVQNLLATGGTSAINKENNAYYETHTFTASGNFVFNSTASVSAQVLVVAGGGGGGMTDGIASSAHGGGGGGGGVIVHNSYGLTAKSYAVTVGDGGAGATKTESGTNGEDSKFGNDFVAKGGGGGSGSITAVRNSGISGGSGGGGTSIGGKAVAQTAPTGASTYGNSGGNGIDSSAGGGGGAGGAGATPSDSWSGSTGGIGVSSSITGQAVYYGGGGASGRDVSQSDSYGASSGNAGAANTGDGGCGGGTITLTGTKGGSGIVVVRFPVPSAQ